jgi:hypothetical protein
MKKTATFRTLLKELDRDPRVRQAMARAKRENGQKDRVKVEGVTGILSLALTIASRFSRKKKARTLEEMRDAISFLVEASLLLKENIFDRPEVKKFVRQRSKQIYSFAQECMAMVLPKKARGVRPKLAGEG